MKLRRNCLIGCIITVMIFSLSTVAYGIDTAAWSPEESIAEMAPSSTEPWFDIKPETPHAGAGISWCIDDPLYNLNFYQSDHTFVGVNLQFPPPDEGYDMLTNIFGSYLFKFGLFIGADYYNWDSNYDWTISPGYRFNLNSQGYVAASIDYHSSNTSDSEVSGCKLDGQYYDDGMLLYCKVHLPKAGKTIFEADTNFKANEELIWGVKCNSEEKFYTAGLTWTRGLLVWDGEAGSKENVFYFGLNGAYNFNEQFTGGVEYSKKVDVASETMLRLKYSSKLVTLNFMYTLDPKKLDITYRLGF